ncbi:zinc finger protein 22-like isoform X1 [Lagopus muta]|uniref:zinc finger protein 22-like isoform X1 n=1 Tax=Lagopus muta TaxID=64668 RepID=UPI0020A058E9|nr:zinc finger protein 22-like isoform X1 [Lagopus muta]XP_048798626.1 zinc finger protein 22-like isoform X1 [Lagopus muta]
MVDPVKLCESSSSQLNWPQPEEPFHNEEEESKESKIKYYLLTVVTEDDLKELGITKQDCQDFSRNRRDGLADRLEKEGENHEQEGLENAEKHKVSSGSQRENIFQNNDQGCQKGEKSQNASLQTAFEEKQTAVSKKRCCNVENFQDNVISGRPSPGQSSYECTVCKRCFSRSSSLLNHLCTQTAKKLHKCTQCNKVFNCNSALIQHQKMHQRQKISFECSDCGDRFTCRSSLVIHQRTHKREKRPYMCLQCNQCFHHASELITHPHL